MGRHVLPRLAPWALLLVGTACSGREPPAPTPALERPVPEAVRLALGARFSCALDDGAEVRCWGDVPFEVAGRAVEDRVRSPHAIVGATDVHEIAADDETLCVRTAARHVLCAGEDVRAGGARERLVEVRDLRGASSIAVIGARVCAVIESALRCVGLNLPRNHDRVVPGSWLEVAGSDVCVLDGLGPARCLAPEASTLWPVTGSEGATSIALARGICITTAAGALRCDASATSRRKRVSERSRASTMLASCAAPASTAASRAPRACTATTSMARARPKAWTSRADRSTRCRSRRRPRSRARCARGTCVRASARTSGARARTWSGRWMATCPSSCSARPSFQGHATSPCSTGPCSSWARAARSCACRWRARARVAWTLRSAASRISPSA